MTHQSTRQFIDLEVVLVLAHTGSPLILHDQGGLVAAMGNPTGKPSGVLMFHGNLVQGSATNITPLPRNIAYLTTPARYPSTDDFVKSLCCNDYHGVAGVSST